MPHAVVLLAKAVMADTSNYPEVVRTFAQQIIRWHEEKRMLVQALWSRKKLWRDWQASVRDAKLQCCSGSPLAHRRMASAIFSRKGHTAEDRNLLHSALAVIGTGTRKNLMQFAVFEATKRFAEETDLAKVLHYFSCVNAERLDSTLESVAYLRWVSPWAAVAEILAWHAVRERTKQLSPGCASLPSLGG